MRTGLVGGFFSIVTSFLLFSQDLPPVSEFPPTLGAEISAEFAASSWFTSAGIVALPFEILVSDDQEIDPLTDYLSRFLPTLLLTRIPELPFRPLNSDERSGIYLQTADKIRARRLQVWADHRRQQSLAELRSQAFVLRDDLGLRAEEGTWLHPDRIDLEIVQAASPLPATLDLSVVDISDGFEADERLGRWIHEYYTRELGEDSAPSFRPQGLTYPYPFQTLDTQGKSLKADYLLFGAVQVLGDNAEFFGVTYAVYSRFSRSIVLEGSFFSSKALAPEVARDEARHLAIELSGQPRGRMQVTVLPPVYEIRVNNEVRGRGQVELDLVPVGEVLVEVLDGTRLVESKSLVLDADSPREVAFLLPPPKFAFVPLGSEPPGVPVLIDGTLKGVTPFLAPLSPRPSVVEFDFPGYHRRTFVTDEETASHGLTLALFDERIDWTYEVEARRDRFYRALGVTAITTLVPLVLNGLFQEAATLARANLSNSTLIGRANDLFWIRNTSYLLTGVSAVYTLFELGRYIDAARASLTR